MTEQTPSAHDVIVAALAVDAPEGEGRVHRQAQVIEAALVQYGHLPGAPATLPTETNVRETADWLAEQSGFARYPDGARLMESPRDVEVAAAYADRRVTTEADRASVGGARTVLLAWHLRNGRP